MDEFQGAADECVGEIANRLGYRIPLPWRISEFPHALALYAELTEEWSAGLFWEFAWRKRDFDDHDALSQLRRELQATLGPERLEALLDQRAKMVFEQVREHVVGMLLDCGCGDGRVASRFMPGHDLTLADIRDYRICGTELPFVELSDDCRLPFSDASFESVALLTVLHHSNDPERLLREALRVSSERVVIIESVIGGESPCADNADAHRRLLALDALDRQERCAFAAFADWVYNCVILDDVPVPFNFGTRNDWIDIATTSGAKLVCSETLAVDQVLVPESHELLVFEP